MIKLFTIIFVIIICCNAYCQAENGVDSINKIYWEYSIFIVNEDGTPYKYIKNEFYFETDLIYFIEGDTNSFMTKTSYIKSKRVALPTDTLYLKNSKTYDDATKKILKIWGYNPHFSKSHCEYINGEKDGTELIYFSNGELSGVIINNNFRLKTKGKWKKGKKTGKWIEYYPNGNIMKTQIFRNGKLIKEKTLPNNF